MLCLEIGYACHDSTAPAACKNWQPDTRSGTYLPPNTREASYATIFPYPTIAPPAIVPLHVFGANPNLRQCDDIHYCLSSQRSDTQNRHLQTVIVSLLSWNIVGS